jgi:hypothetical protein
MPVISSVEQLVGRYHVWSCPLTADDFTFENDEARKDAECLFRIKKDLRAWYDQRLKQNKGTKIRLKMSVKQLEEMLLKWFLEDPAKRREVGPFPPTGRKE